MKLREKGCTVSIASFKQTLVCVCLCLNVCVERKQSKRVKQALMNSEYRKSKNISFSHFYKPALSSQASDMLLDLSSNRSISECLLFSPCSFSLTFYGPLLLNRTALLQNMFDFSLPLLLFGALC